jgi:predicted porin
MNNKIKLAVAGAVLSAASVANAGIVIPAGDWTMDINGNVNIFAQMTKADDTAAVNGGIATVKDRAGEDTKFSMGTGLLPAWLGFTGTTRQNDLDVSFTISIQPSTSNNSSTGDANDSLTRQAFITFGDASWGTVKMGKDLGIFASNAILNDITLLGVGGLAAGGITTLGGIGSGYLYPAFRGQIAYTTPNMNGLQITAGITNPDQGQANVVADNDDMDYFDDRFGIEAQATYSFTNGKVWAGVSSYEVAGVTDYDATAADVGAAFNAGNFGLVAYYYSGEGNGAGTHLNRLGSNALAPNLSAAGQERDQDGGYLQATYVIPSGTKLGVAVATSQNDLASGETVGGTDAHDSNDRWTVGAYHPLTKHLNLVAEYNDIESDDHQGDSAESQHFALGAILFF